MMIQLTEEDLLARMETFEDHFVERKVSGDEKDWLKTVVAFANSAPLGFPCILYIGVKDQGEIETPQRNLDEIQQRCCPGDRAFASRCHSRQKDK
jgi:predicted HTH transcriptional regulator